MNFDVFCSFVEPVFKATQMPVAPKWKSGLHYKKSFEVRMLRPVSVEWKKRIQIYRTIHSYSDEKMNRFKCFTRYKYWEMVKSSQKNTFNQTECLKFLKNDAVVLRQYTRDYI